MRVTIVIPNWNGEHLLKKHLQSVVSFCKDTEIIVSDDMSTDGSVVYIRTHFPKVIVVERKKREGFAANVNTGVSRATGDIVVLLNTDVEPEPDFLKPLLVHFEDSDIFAVGCLEKSLEHGAVVLRGRGLAHWRKGYYVHSRGEVNKLSTAWVAGGSGAFRKSMWDKLGGMDELYNPFYWEDIDLSYRARKAGWKTLFEPKSVVHHYHEEGKIKREFTQKEIKRIAFRNQFIFIWKNVTDMRILFSHILWTPIRLLQTLCSGDVLMTQGFFLAMQQLFRIHTHRNVQCRLYVTADSDLDLRDDAL